MASVAMPGVTGTPEYLSYRKLQVYRATLEGALEDGAITPNERAVLDALARELGIRQEDARAVEAEVAPPDPRPRPDPSSSSSSSSSS